jgi:predicted transcriptional regulator
MHKVKKSKEKRYDWETSESVFQVFKILYEQEKLSLTEIANKLNKNKSTITNKIRSLLDTGLVTKQYEGKEMFYSANKSLLIHKIKNYNKEIKSKYLENINDAINYTNNFKSFFNFFNIVDIKEEIFIKIDLVNWNYFKSTIEKSNKKEIIQLVKEYEKKCL